MSLRSRLSQFTSCDVSDALVHFGLKDGGFVPNLTQRSFRDPNKPRSGVSVVGPAYTVLYAPKSDPRPAVTESYIDNVPENSVLLIGLSENQQLTTAPFVTVNNALYGGLMSARAKYRNAAGSVVLGRVRDLTEHRNLGLPVWSYGVGTTAPGSVVKVVGINVPLDVKVASIDPTVLELETVSIRYGDLIVADEDGVVRIPIGHATEPEALIDIEKVMEYLPKRVDADRNVSGDIQNGRGAAESQKFWRNQIE